MDSVNAKIAQLQALTAIMLTMLDALDKRVIELEDKVEQRVKTLDAKK